MSLLINEFVICFMIMVSGRCYIYKPNTCTRDKITEIIFSCLYTQLCVSSWKRLAVDITDFKTIKYTSVSQFPSWQEVMMKTRNVILWLLKIFVHYIITYTKIWFNVNLFYIDCLYLELKK